MMRPRYYQELNSTRCFSWWNQSASGDTRASLQQLTALMESGMEPLPILGMISRQFRLLAVVRDALEQGGKSAEI